MNNSPHIDGKTFFADLLTLNFHEYNNKYPHTFLYHFLSKNLLKQHESIQSQSKDNFESSNHIQNLII